jgi:hypothetical protein
MKALFTPLLAVLLLACVHSPAQEATETPERKERAERKEKDEAREKERAEKQEAKEAEHAQRNREREESRRERMKENYPEEFKEHISKQFTLQKPASGAVNIYNLEGSVKVEGYAGDKVMIEVDKTIYAKDKDILEQGKKEVKLEFEQVGDSIVAYIREPWDTRPHNWKDGDDGDWHNRKRIEYRCALQFTVKVPMNVSLHASTVNDGDVKVKDVTGKLDIHNVNGGIEIVNAKGITNANTINGDLTVSYLGNPPDASTFYTLNGKLTAIFQPNLSADLQFKSMNGSFYTDFDNAEVLPPTVTRNQEKRGDGTVYRLNKDTKLRIGSGGKQFKFETLNGNIYIKKQS